MLGSEKQEGIKREEGHGDFLWVKAEILVWQPQGAPEKMLLRRDLSKDFLLSDGVQEGGCNLPATPLPWVEVEILGLGYKVGQTNNTDA